MRGTHIESANWEHAGLMLAGLSLAGVRTCVTLPQYSICFDVAQGLPHGISMGHFFITHGHLDHAAGIPYVISQKAMNSHPVPVFYMPEAMVDPMTQMMHQWARIEGFEYDFNFRGVRPGEEIAVKSNLVVRPFTTVHRVPSLGYSVYRRSRKLKGELRGLDSKTLAEIEDKTEEKLELLLSFTGDTQIEFLDRAPEVRASKILVMEATYLDERKSVQSARDWGHTHLAELIPRLETISSEKIVLIHSSARYAFHEAAKMLRTQLPAHEHDRVVLFPGR